MQQKKADVERSEQAILKEQEYEALLKKRKKIITELKRAKTRFENLKKNIEDTHRELFAELFPAMADFVKRKQVVAETIQKTLNSKKLSTDIRFNFNNLVNDVFEALYMGAQEDEVVANIEMSRDYQKKMEEGTLFDEEDFQNGKDKSLHDILEDFRSIPDDEEQRDIRKIYIKLANRFHPDKAKNAKETELYHTMMQHINSAYKIGDVAALYDIEADSVNVNENEKKERKLDKQFSDIIDKDIEFVKKQIQQLEQQLERTKADTKALRKSDYGESYKHNRSLEKDTGMNVKDLIDTIKGFHNVLDKLVAVNTEIYKSKKETAKVLSKIKELNEAFDEILQHKYLNSQNEDYTSEPDFEDEMSLDDLELLSEFFDMFKDDFGDLEGFDDFESHKTKKKRKKKKQRRKKK